MRHDKPSIKLKWNIDNYTNAILHRHFLKILKYHCKQSLLWSCYYTLPFWVVQYMAIQPVGLVISPRYIETAHTFLKQQPQPCYASLKGSRTWEMWWETIWSVHVKQEHWNQGSLCQLRVSNVQRFCEAQLKLNLEK
jgi:hypothetical protein